MSKFFFSIAWVVTGGVGIWLFTPATASAVQPPSSYNIPNPPHERLKDFTIVEDQGTWHVFAMSVCLDSSCTRPSSVIWHYVSRDLVNWTNLGTVLAPRPGGIDSGDVWAPSVVRNNNQWLMYYTAVVHQNNMPVQRIALATSDDLQTWNRTDNNIVLECSSLSWAYWNLNDTQGIGGDCRDPFVYRDPTQPRWLMTVSTRTTGQWGEHQMMIGQAWSDDGLVWHELAGIPSTKGWTAESAHVFHYQNRSYLFWTRCAAGQSCIQWADASSPSESFSAAHNLQGIESWGYASEALFVGQQPVILYVGFGLSEHRLTFDQNNPTVTSIGLPFSIFQPRLQVPDVPAEQWPGLANMSFLIYRQSGSAWNPDQDQFIGSVESNASTQAIAILTPGSYWLVPDPSEFLPGATLDHFAPTTYAQSLVLDWDQIATFTWDVTLAGRRWNLGSTETNTNHTTIPTSTSSNVAIPFSQLQSISLIGSGVSSASIVLSNDDGQTWWTVEDGTWVETESTAVNAASFSAVNQAVATFPLGNGLLRWNLFLPTEAVAVAVDVALDSPASTPQVLAPQHGAHLESVRPTLSFQSSDQGGAALSYLVQYCTADCQTVESYSMPTGWTGMQQGFGLSGQSVSWTPDASLGNGLLGWRVRSADRNGSGQWSEWTTWSEVHLPNAATINANATIISTTAATINWQTNYPSTIYIYYADELDHEYLSHQALTEDQITLSDFLPGASYDLEVRATDVYGQNVTTYLHLDMPTTSTVVSQISAQWETSGLRIQWETSGPATGQVRYGGVNNMSQTITSSGSGTSHTVLITALAEGQVVQYQISGQGGTSYSSSVLTYTPPVANIGGDLEPPADLYPILRPGRIIRPRR